MVRGGRTARSGIWPTSPVQPDTGISLTRIGWASKTTCQPCTASGIDVRTIRRPDMKDVLSRLPMRWASEVVGLLPNKCAIKSRD